MAIAGLFVFALSFALLFLLLACYAYQMNETGTSISTCEQRGVQIAGVGGRREYIITSGI